MADEMSPEAKYENLAYPDEDLPYEGEAGGDARYAKSLDSLNGDPETARVTFDTGTSSESSVDFSSLLEKGLKTVENVITTGINASRQPGGQQVGSSPTYGYSPPVTQLPYVQTSPVGGGALPQPPYSSTGQASGGAASTQALATTPKASSPTRTVWIVAGVVASVAVVGVGVAAASRGSRRRRTMDF